MLFVLALLVLLYYILDSGLAVIEVDIIRARPSS